VAPVVRTASLLAALALGCATSTPRSEMPTAPPPAGAADALYWLLLGRFDSADQARSSPGYVAVQVVACRAQVSGMGPRALYVEEARMETPGAPYRQRVYVLEPLEPSASVAMAQVFDLENPGAAAGACGRAEPPRFTRDALVERVGCAMRLRAEGSVWRGSTSGRGCPTTLGGATYAESEVMLDAVGFRSWERGFDATGAQKYGADAGPYVFLRRTPLPVR